MNEIDAEAELEKIAERVSALCDAGQKSGRPYYISALGIELGEDLAKIKLLTKSGLADFVRNRLADKFELVRFGSHGNVLAIIPVGGSLPVQEEAEDGAILDSQGRPKFHYRLWAAFSVPPSSSARFLRLDDLTFVDTDADSPPDEGALLIPTEMIPSGDLPRRDDVIWQNLTRWLQDNKLPPERFYARAKRVPKAPKPPISAGGSLLEAIIGTLDRRQLQSTQMSLDAISALLQTRR